MSCPTGKVQLTVNRAKKLAKRSSATHDKPMTAYRCRECGEWHLGQLAAPRTRRIRLLRTNHQVFMPGKDSP